MCIELLLDFIIQNTFFHHHYSSEFHFFNYKKLLLSFILATTSCQLLSLWVTLSCRHIVIPLSTFCPPLSILLNSFTFFVPHSPLPSSFIFSIAITTTTFCHFSPQHLLFFLLHLSNRLDFLNCPTLSQSGCVLGTVSSTNEWHHSFLAHSMPPSLQIVCINLYTLFSPFPFFILSIPRIFSLPLSIWRQTSHLCLFFWLHSIDDKPLCAKKWEELSLLIYRDKFWFSSLKLCRRPIDKKTWYLTHFLCFCQNFVNTLAGKATVHCRHLLWILPHPSSLPSSVHLHSLSLCFITIAVSLSSTTATFAVSGFLQYLSFFPAFPSTTTHLTHIFFVVVSLLYSLLSHFSPTRQFIQKICPTLQQLFGSFAVSAPIW